MKSSFKAILYKVPAREMVRGPLLVPVIFLLSLLITWPAGNFPLNDDWTYGKTVLWLVNDGVYKVGISAASLWTHIQWGALFVRVFGFSFNVLRASTIVAALLCAILLYRLFIRMGCNRGTALAGTAIVIFNPIFYCLSLTYMTDVTFCSLLVVCLYLAWQYWTNKKLLTLFLFFVCSSLLVLLRQFGLLIPLAFIAGSLFTSDGRWKTAVFAVILTAAVAGIFLLYEKYLASTSQGEIYQGTSKIRLTDPLFWNVVYGRVDQWFSIMLVQIFCAAAPFLIVYLVSLVRLLKAYSIPVLLGGVLLAYLWFEDKWFPMGNVFTNMSLGTETFYQNLTNEVSSAPYHTYSETFHWVLQGYKLLACTICVSVILLFIVSLLMKRMQLPGKPMVVMCITFIIGYLFLLCVADGIFDRYHLPMIIALMVASATSGIKGRAVWAIPFILVFMYVSIAGTKDYFQLNRLRWEANTHLRVDRNIPMGEINGGYEVNCWHEGQDFIFWDSFFLHSHNYLIQYRREPGFSVYREYPFQRYFPYKKDKIYIFERDQKKQISQ